MSSNSWRSLRDIDRELPSKAVTRRELVAASCTHVRPGVAVVGFSVSAVAVSVGGACAGEVCVGAGVRLER